MSECVLGHGEERSEAEVGLLCLWHRNRMTSTTASIRELWLDLALILEAGSAPKDEAPKTRHLKSAEAPAPANLEALALRDPRSSTVPLATDESTPIPPVLFVVASWLLCLAEERPLTETRSKVIIRDNRPLAVAHYIAPMTLPRSVIAQLNLLTRHHDWIAGQLWVDDYCAEMGDLRKALKAALRDVTHREVGRCYLPHDDRPRCGGALIAENGSSVVRCNGCRASWVTAQEQARLAVTLESA